MKVIPITPLQVAEEDDGHRLYASEKKIYPRAVTGRFARWRWGFVAFTQLVFYGLPWLQWNDRQAVLFDLGARRFYLFGYVLYPQDFIYLTGLLVLSALSLFLFTAIAGRLWCGFTCPQTVYTEMFLWIERKVEGDRPQRMKLDAASFSLEKLVKKSFKHLLWGMLAMWTGFTFVGYFTPITALSMEFIQTRMGSWEVFWVFFYAFATYGNAGFMREQVCKYMCPYARFQSAMFDHDTLIVSYDAARGEPRGTRGRKDDFRAKGLGACIDCDLCVQVCPTGIDIRKGLQYECIGCGGCVDVCNTVMDKMHYPRGLIRFTTQNALKQGASAGSGYILRRVLRPRVLVYGTILLVLTAAMMFSLALRTPLRVDVVRDRAALSRIVAGGKLENVYRLQVMNATEQPQRYHLAAEGLQDLAVASEPVVEVGPAESRWVAVRLQIPYGSAPSGSHPIHFDIRSEQGADHVREKSVFLVPR
ncbi:cytochrome c oxidase accessory protein CcoG [Ramlibacter ginsenosidimutans]|uniref:Cytochrome c oxidase accessory protein CcoG n=1 Tax=Ramlibacter ginsenosidimutans TaxID=502333 RepID=A0A934TXP7_9BURK|nr:cytochrome c oxidase accessory protein CcoG [Ramlibacter ginsenosidimutans]MBK6009433.1 cytochrome c oxidase accessory protein CcoG [Ramlibacter ginsenosidimutans]